MAEQGHQGREQPDIREVRPVHDEWLSHGWHWSYGWLRRIDMDNDGGYRGFCYEAPDGDMIYTQRRDHRLICFFEQWRDRETGEVYLTLHPDRTASLIRRYGHARRDLRQGNT